MGKGKQTTIKMQVHLLLNRKKLQTVHNWLG
uniref:Uncharacterized protein n=1 Tax=Rhizophora mucronata TaxID=61149 RepID=A0A2P2Q6M9_RHIMU